MVVANRKRKVELDRIGLSHHIYLAPEIDKQLFDLVRMEGRSLSDLIREAIVMLLDNRQSRRSRG